MATIGTGNSKLFFSRSKKLFKALFILISIASPVILSMASPAILADESSLTARHICGTLTGDSRKYDLSKSAVWTEPLRYTISKDGNTAIFRQAFIGLGQQAEFEHVIGGYDQIHLIESCVDYITLNRPVTVALMSHSAFHANVPIGSRFGNLTNVLFRGVRNDAHTGRKNQKLNKVRFEDAINDVVLEYVDADNAVFDPVVRDWERTVYDLEIHWSNIRGADFTGISFIGSRIEWTDAAEAKFTSSRTIGLNIRCTNLEGISVSPDSRFGFHMAWPHNISTPNSCLPK